MKKLTLLFVFSVLFLSISLSYSAETKNLFTNPGFESDDLSVWTVTGAEIARADTPVSSGGYSINMTGRKEKNDGIEQNVTDKVALGYAYTVSGNARLEASENWDKLSVYVVLTKETEKTSIFLGDSDIRNSAWAHFSYTFMVPDKAEIKKVSVLFRPSFSMAGFYLDDLSLRPSVQVRSSGNKLSVNIGPLTADQKGLKANLKVQDVLDNNVFTGTLNLAEDTLINLENGFYRANVDAVDSDGESFAVEKTFCVGALDEVVDVVLKENQELTASSEKSAYHGWLRYLQYILDNTRERFPDNIEGITNAAYRLNNWIAKIKENPNLIKSLSGVIEWAYLSEVDNSGQPFKLAIPTDYSSDKSFALEVSLHGSGGNHLEYSGGVRSQPGRFYLGVLGRARRGGFSDLSEADVMDAIKYVQEYWNIDPRQVHLVGTSMGGWGTFSLCTRYPDIFASARPQCGAGVMMPIENMLHVPLYSVHSADDPTVPVLQDRAPVRNLIQFGGKAVIDETTGLGHAAWSYSEGNTRAAEFAFSHILPDMKEVRRIHYTAMDGFARKAYWVEVNEWGPEPRSAVVDARIDEANVLYVNLDNINTLKVDVGKSPINTEENLKVVVNGKYPIIYNAPLPETLYVKLQEDSWAVLDNLGEAKPYRLHYPGGADLLYQGEPLMIVWGTKADTETNKRMYDAAQAARKSCYPNWPDDNGKGPQGEGEGVDGVPHNRILYSTLLGKPDVDVTESDLQKYNLVLIGTAEQNSIVAEIAENLPVQLKTNRVKCSDGIDWDIRDAVVGLTYHNPKAPKRLIFWIASNNPEFYQPQSEVLDNMTSFNGMPDLVVAGLKDEEVIASRFFDSHWNWESDYKKSPFCSPHIKTGEDMQKEIAKVFIRATGSDMSLIYTSQDSDTPSYRTNRRRIADLTGNHYYMPIAEMTLSGKKILAYQEWFKEHPTDYGSIIAFYPQVSKLTLKEDQMYKISMYPYTVWDMRGITVEQPPDEYRITDIQATDAIEKYFPTVLQTHKE
jgi:pimeloyl-ACP methyl ester carboxylesterase